MKHERLKKKRKGSFYLLNMMTVLLVLGTILIVVLNIYIYENPNAAFNPYPPPAAPPKLALVTHTPESTPLASLEINQTSQPTQTITNTALPSATLTSTTTPTAVNTPFIIILPTHTPAPTMPGVVSTNSPYPFVVMPGSPASMSYGIMQPDVGCRWLGVGGNVVDLQGAPYIGLRIQLFGYLRGRLMEKMSISGTINRYGGAGYEIMIDDHPLDSYHTLWVQLFNQAGGEISDEVYFNTSDVCEKNLIIINFKQVR